MHFGDLQVLWVTLCRRRSTRTCLSPQTGVITGEGRWGALTTTAYWTLGVWSWPWRPSVKDKSRPSSTEWIFLYILCISSFLCTRLLHTPSCPQVLHRRGPVLEVVQLHRAALFLCGPGVRAGDQGHECQRVGLPARRRRPAHVGGRHHRLPEPHYKRVWVETMWNYYLMWHVATWCDRLEPCGSYTLLTLKHL